MAWYDEPGDYQTSPAASETYKATLPETVRNWNIAADNLQKKRESQEDEIDALERLLEYYRGSGDFVTQWLINNSIGHIRSRMESSKKAVGMAGLAAGTERRAAAMDEYEGEMEDYRAATADYEAERQSWEDAPDEYFLPEPDTEKPEEPEVPVGWDEQSIAKRDRLLRWSEAPARTERQKSWEHEGLEIPDWMIPYQANGGYEDFGLAPMSAKADLDVEEMGGLQGYMGWTKLGRPEYYSEEYARGMESLPNWWEQYVTKSQELFPQSGRGRQTNWRTARQ